MKGVDEAAPQVAVDSMAHRCVDVHSCRSNARPARHIIAQGIAEHSTFNTGHRGRRRRFHKTVDAMLRIAFGTEQEASAAFAGINAIHDRVSGRLPQAAGAFPGGTPYSAHDPACSRGCTRC